jgi:PKD repeat protein
MISRLSCFLFFVFVLQFQMVSGQGSKRRVLFLGNSYTHTNNLPAMLATAAASVGDTLVYDTYAPGGYTFDLHLNDPQTLSRLQQGNWDFVVLQDQSQRPALPQYSLHGSLALSGLIRNFSPCARPLFFRTWGRKNGDSQFCPTWPPVCSYAGMDSLLHLRYTQMAETNHAEICPVGETWKYLRQNQPNLELYNPDGSHPSAAGTYAGAMSFYASIFKKDPGFISFDGGLSSAQASVIRQAARQVVFQALDSLYFPQDPPEARFGYEVLPGPTNAIQLVNQSVRYDSFAWNFGDGSNSFQQNPVHTYSLNGSFVVSLTASRCDLNTVFTHVFLDTVSFCAFTPTISPDTIFLCAVNPDTLRSGPGDSYQWIGPDGNLIPNASQSFVIPSLAGNHSVEVSIGGCTERSVPALVNSIAGFNFYYVSPSSTDTLCLGDSVLLTLLPVTSPMPSDQEIRWFRNGEFLPLSSNDILQVYAAGLYHAVVYDTLYCPGSPLFTTASVPVVLKECATSFKPTQKFSPILIFPNPGREFTVQVPQEQIGSGFLLLNAMGQPVRQGVLDKPLVPLELKTAPIGIYFLKVGQRGVFRLESN